jgi:hypothetical protein
VNGDPPRDRPSPYGWAIEYPVSGGSGREIRIAFVPNDAHHDLAGAMQRAVDLHGELVPVYTERRKQ